MIKISDLVWEIIEGDETALESLRARILNLSAYAEKIQPQIEARLYKPVKKGSIVVALSRLALSIMDPGSLRPQVKIDDMSIKSPLCEITYEKTEATIRDSSFLKTDSWGNKSFFTITQGIGEITIIFPEQLKANILNAFSAKPKGQYHHLTAITVRFVEEDYIDVPNMIFTLVSALAIKRINIIEIVSTFTELSFIIKNKDMQVAVDALRQYFHPA